MNAQVATVASRVPVESYYRYDIFIESLRRFAEVPTVLGMNEPWRGLMEKPYQYRQWLREGRNASDRLILCDAYDIVFTKHPHGIGDDCARLYGDSVVCNGEKSLWPRSDLADAFTDRSSPWSFLNSGFMCGPADKILALLEYMDIESIGFDPPGGPYPNDQSEFQRLFSEQDKHGVKMVVDVQCNIAQTLSACEMDEFDFSGPNIRNKVTGTEPGVFHLNGGAKEIFGPAIYAKYNLP